MCIWVSAITTGYEGFFSLPSLVSLASVMCLIIFGFCEGISSLVLFLHFFEHGHEMLRICAGNALL